MQKKNNGKINIHCQEWDIVNAASPVLNPHFPFPIGGNAVTVLILVYHFFAFLQ